MSTAITCSQGGKGVPVSKGLLPGNQLVVGNPAHICVRKSPGPCQSGPRHNKTQGQLRRHTGASLPQDPQATGKGDGGVPESCGIENGAPTISTFLVMNLSTLPSVARV